MRTLLATLLVGFLLACAGSVLAARPDAEQKKIDYLIASIEALDGATFIRNGGEYSAAKAADHLRLKLLRVGDRIETADQFIDELGTKSSMSGEKYHIRLKDGRVLESAQFFRTQLAQYSP
jgi:Family of unknown function (DUF5329)